MTTSDLSASGSTATPGSDHAWLPDHQVHVVATVAHVHELLASLTEVIYDYVAVPGGPLTLDTVPAGNQARVVVTAVTPLPAAISRYAATALTELRAAVEHVLYAEVEKELGHGLSEEQGRQVEMPAVNTAGKLDDWLRHGRRRQIRPLRDGPLVTRIRDLQPYQGEAPDDHPLRLLADYTNRAKHRAPAVAATRLGRVWPDSPAPGLFVRASGDAQPLQAGDVVASGPRYQRASLSIIPTVSLQRPHSGAWHVLINEIETIEAWVRTVAIPTLITGTSEVAPLPPRLDITVGHEDLRAAMATAGTRTVVEQFRRRLDVRVAREGLVDVLLTHPSRPSEAVLRPWAQSLTDDQVLDKQRSLPVSTDRRDAAAVMAAVDKLLAEAQRH